MAGNLLIVVREVLDELRIDVQEVIGLIFEQFGVDDVWDTVGQTTREIIRSAGQIRISCFSSLGQVGRRRSIVRMIGSMLPFRPARRPYLRLVKEVNGSTKRKWDFIANGEHYPYLEDVAYVYKFVGHDRESSIPSIRCASLLTDPEFDLHSTTTSTPNAKKSISSMSTGSTARLSDSTDFRDAMRDDLDELRLQMAALVEKMSLPKSNHYPSPVRSTNRQAPPPPPPLPEIPVFAPGYNATTEENEVPVKRNIHHLTPSSRGLHPRSATNSLVDMVHILKDIGNVKLRPVARSPGGTPLRIKPKTDKNDPASIMSAAIKKRFAHMETLQESQLDKENYDSDNSTWDCDSPYPSPRGKRL